MFPGVRDPVGPAVAFRMPHTLLFPVEMPMDKGRLVGAGCTELTLAIAGTEAEVGAPGGKVCITLCPETPPAFLLLLLPSCSP